MMPQATVGWEAAAALKFQTAAHSRMVIGIGRKRRKENMGISPSGLASRKTAARVTGHSIGPCQKNDSGGKGSLDRVRRRFESQGGQPVHRLPLPMSIATSRSI